MSYNILAVDDNKTILELIQNVLSDEQYNLHCISDNEIALTYIENNLPDLILLDIMMPKIDGFELCKIIKQNDRTKHIPVIYITAVDDEEYMETAFKYGAIDYIKKPFIVFEFRMKIDNHLKIIKAQQLLRKELERSKKNKEKYENIINNLNDVYYRTDKKGILIMASPSIVNFFGYDNIDDIIGKPFKKFHKNPDDRKIFVKNIKKEKSLKNVHNILLKKDGTEIIAQTSANILLNDKEHFIGVDGIIRDVTELKKQETELKKLSEAVKQSANSIVFTNLEGEIEYVNQKFTDVTGYTYDEALGENPRVLKSGKQDDSVYKELWETITKGKSWSGEFHNKAKNGKLFWEKATIFPIKNNEDEIISYVAIKEDITEKKEFENNLLLSQEVANLGHYVLDIKTGNWTSSAQLNTIFGIDENSKMDMKAWSEIIHPDDREKMLNYFEINILQNHEIFDKEYKIINKKTGKNIWVHGKGELRFDGDNIVEMYGTIQDVTVQMKNRIDLKQTKEFAENLLETANTFIIGLNKNAEITIFNEYAENITGYSKEEVIGKNWFKIFIPDNEKNNIQMVFSDVLKKMPKASINENVIITKQKKELNISWSNNVLKDSNNETIGALGIGRDITEQKKAEKALAQNEFNLRNIFNKSNDGITITSFKVKIIDVNETICKRLEYTKQELIKKSVSLVRPNYETVDRAKVIDRLKTDGSIIFESTNVSKSGKKYIVEISSILFNYFGQKTILSTSRDITERKEMEQKLLTAIIETEEKERQRIAQDIHDGLGPLMSTIKLYVQWAMKPDIKGNKAEILKKAETVVSEAYTLLQNISNNLSPHILQNFGLISALNSFTDRVKEITDIDIIIESNLNQKTANIKDTILYRIFTEAVNNTIKHAKATKITISIYKMNEKIVAEYIDNGIGFDVEDIINSKKGQGLYNIQNRIKSIDGKIKIESIKNKGTQINIII
ncbi:MAG: PAS domain S-box protein [Bacteroidota bacterium]|nr:PAS domain S-box protein [Bacteroidota bacterium]